MLTRARFGGSDAVLLRGPHGVGKSALLGWVQERAGGFRVLATAAPEGEAGLPYATLHALLRPVLPLRGDLMPPQRRALEVALAIAEGVVTDRLAVGAAVLELLASASDEAPVLVCVDDAQWCDAASADVLRFVARRLDGEAVALLVAGTGDGWDGGGSRFEPLALEGVAPADVREIVERAGVPQPGSAVVDHLWRATGGNPAAVLLAATSLSEDQLAGRAPLPMVLRAPEAVERHVKEVLRAAPPRTAAALLHLAALDGGDAAAVGATLGALGDTVDALLPAEHAGLVKADSGRIDFAHPLIRSAVYHLADPAARRRAHAAAAEWDAPERRPWHLAAAAVGPDPTAVAALTEAADGATRRGAHAAAAAALAMAAQLSEGRPARFGLSVAAARAAWNGGRPALGEDLALRAASEATQPGEHATVAHLHGRILARTGRAAEAASVLMGAASDAPTDQRVSMLSDTTLPLLRAGRPREALAAAERAVREAAEAPDPLTRARALYVRGISRAYTGDPLSGARDVADADDLRGPGALEPELDACVALARWAVGDVDGARRGFEALVHRARAQAVTGILPYALVRRGMVDLHDGDWVAARAAVDEAAEVAEAIDGEADLGLAAGILAWLDAATGREPSCRANVRRSDAIAGRLGAGSRRAYTAASLGLLELGAGRHAEAADHLEPVVRSGREQGWGDAGVPPHVAPDLIEALVRAGRAAEARTQCDRFAVEVGRSGRPTARAALHRCRGLLAHGGEVSAEMERAMAAHLETRDPFGQARTLLCLGEHLRRHGQRRRARDTLASALVVFDGMGAAPWTARTQRELVAAGGARVATGDPDLAELTPRERTIAGLVGEGATNREIAERLFLSPKTVEMHLSSIYRRLGIRSRAALAVMTARRPG